MHRVLATGTVVLALLVSATACGTSVNVGGSSGASQGEASSSASASASASGGCDHNVDWSQLSQDHQNYLTSLSSGQGADATSIAVASLAGEASGAAGMDQNPTQKGQLTDLSFDLQKLTEDYSTLATSNVAPASLTTDQAQVETDWLPLAVCTS